MTISSALPDQSAAEADPDESNKVKVTTCILLGVTVTVFVARQIIKSVVYRRMAFDDLFILLATISAIGLAVTIIIVASEGLGRPGFQFREQAETIMKGYYASEMLYIASICFSKLSLLVLVHTIVATNTIQRRAVLGLGTMVFAWTIASLLAVIFQCKLSRPWKVTTLNCFNAQVFWIIYCIVDMATEVCIIALSIHVVADLKIQISRKLGVVACFAPRVLVMTASLARLVWLYPITSQNRPEYYLWLPTIITEVHVCLSICTACIPYMAPFFKNVESGLRRTYLSKSQEFRVQETPRRKPSIFRRHERRAMSDSWDFSVARSLRYDRVPQESPHIPTPKLLSPLTPPQCPSPPSTSDRHTSLTSTQQGLRINIPGQECSSSQIDIATPHTASSFALSPSCASPMPFPPTKSYIRTQQAPMPPPKAHSSYAPIPNRPPLPLPPSPAQPRFSLFPPQTPRRQDSPLQRPSGSPSLTVPLIRSRRSQNANTPSRSSRTMSPSERSEELLLRVGIPLQPLKFSTAPRPASPPPTAISSTSDEGDPTQEPTSPMGTAINNYFENNPPEPPRRELKYLAPPSPKWLRNSRVLSPINSSRTQPLGPESPPQARTAYDPFENDLGFPRDSIIVAKSARAGGMPQVRDARHSPRLVIRRAS